MNDFDEDLQQDLRQEVSQAERRHDDQFESEPFVNSPVDRSQLDVDPERLYSRPVDGLRRDLPDRRRTSNRPLIEQEEERKTFVDDGDGGGRQSLPSEPGGQGQRQARAMIPDVLEPGEERDRLEGKVGTANGVSEWGQVISGEANAARRRGEGRYGASAAQSWTGLGLKAGAGFGGGAVAVMTGPLAPVTKKVIDRGLSAIGEVTQYVGDKRREAVDPQGLVEHQALIDQANIFHQGVDSSEGTYNSNVRTDVEPDERRELNRREAVAELGVRFEKRENAKRNWAGRQQRTGARVLENVASVPLRAVGAMVKGMAALPKQLAGFFGRTIPKYARKAWKGLTTDKSRRKAATAARLQQDLRKPDELAALEARGWDNMGRTYGRYFTDPKVYARRQLRSQLAREAYERGDDQSAITESRYYQKKSAQWTKDAKKERDAQKKFDEDKSKAEKDGKPAPTNSKIAFYRNREKGIRDEVRAMQSRLGYDRMVGMSDVKTLGDATSDPRQKFLRGDANAVENSAAYGTVEAKYATPDMTAVMDAAKRDLWAGHDRQSVGDEETRLGNLQHRPPRSAPPEEQNSSLIEEELKEEQNQQEPGQVPDQKEPKIAPKPAWPGPRAADVPQTSRGAALGSGMADFGDKLTKALIKPAKGLADNAQLVGQALGQGLPSALLASQNYQGLEDMAPVIEFGQNLTDANKTFFKGPMDTVGVPLYGDALGTVADSISAGVQARHRQDDAAKTGLWKRQAVTDLQRMGDAQKLLLAEKKSRFGEGSPEVKRALRNRFRNAVRLASANQKLAKAQSGAGITSLNEYSKRETDFINQTIDKPDENPVFTRPEKAGSRIANAGSRIAGFFRRKPAPAAVIDAGGQDQLLAGSDDSYEQEDMSRLFEFAPRTKAIPADMGMLGRAAAGAQRKQESTHLEDLDPEALGRQAQKYQVKSRRGKEGDEDDKSDGAFDLDNLSDEQDADGVLLPRSGNSGLGDAPQQRERRSTMMRRASSRVIGVDEGDVASLGGEGSQNNLLEDEDKGDAPQQRERRSTIMRRVSSGVIGSEDNDPVEQNRPRNLIEEQEEEVKGDGFPRPLLDGHQDVADVRRPRKSIIKPFDATTFAERAEGADNTYYEAMDQELSAAVDARSKLGFFNRTGKAEKRLWDAADVRRYTAGDQHQVDLGTAKTFGRVNDGWARQSRRDGWSRETNRAARERVLFANQHAGRLIEESGDAPGRERRVRFADQVQDAGRHLVNRRMFDRRASIAKKSGDEFISQEYNDEDFNPAYVPEMETARQQKRDPRGVSGGQGTGELKERLENPNYDLAILKALNPQAFSASQNSQNGDDSEQQQKVGLIEENDSLEGRGSEVGDQSMLEEEKE